MATQVPDDEELSRAAATIVSLNDSKIGFQLDSGDAFSAKFLGLMAVDTAALGTGLAIREQLGPFWWALMILFFISLAPSAAGLYLVHYSSGPPAPGDDIEAGLQLGELQVYRYLIALQVEARITNRRVLRTQGIYLKVGLGALIVALLVGPTSALLVALKVAAEPYSAAISALLIVLLAVGIGIARRHRRRTNRE